VSLEFAKYQALGNDYLVIEAAALDTPLDPPRVRWLCNRRLGVGADGVILADDAGGRRRVRIWNPDGSEAEKSGNGLRILARYLWDKGAVRDARFEVETAGGAVRCRVLEGGASVEVEMGAVSFDSERIPVAGTRREVLDETLEVAGRERRFSAATLGNPHCVLFCDQVSADEARLLGPLLEAHALFPNRTNVQFVQVIDEAALAIEIWERGAGYTLSSGSSSCAAAAVARRLGLCGASVEVRMPGGSLAVEVAPDFSVRLAGPVTRVARGRIEGWD
jgi:diaminopimelate epimerase